MSKLKLAAYWASSCGGCDVSILDLDEKILHLAEIADILFWPIAVDSKYSTLQSFDDKHIDLCLFNGSIRNTENARIAELLRQKSKILVAYGSCACFGGVPGLANQYTLLSLIDTVYKNNESLQNPDNKTPVAEVKREGRTVEIPSLYDTVRPLSSIVDVDYLMPGCPPNWERLWEVVEVIQQWAEGRAELPPQGATIGAGTKSLCDHCQREKSDGLSIERFYRVHEKVPENDICLMEQGFPCLGSATREGCGWRCINANIPCRGCYGPLPEVQDSGARFLSTIATQMKASTPEEIERAIDTIPDVLGTFYRYTLPKATIWKAKSR